LGRRQGAAQPQHLPEDLEQEFKKTHGGVETLPEFSSVLSANDDWLGGRRQEMGNHTKALAATGEILFPESQNQVYVGRVAGLSPDVPRQQ